MPSYTLIQLKNFKGGLHLARGLTNSYDKSLETLHSDTIKSALFVCALQLNAGLGSNVNNYQVGQDFLNSFKVSSAFPFYKSPSEKEPFYFFPKPEFPLKLESSKKGVEINHKKAKKVGYLEKEMFEKLLNGEATEFEEKNINGRFLTSNKINFEQILKNDECENIMSSQPYQHVNIPRNYGVDSTPYYVDKIYFHQNAGLFFLLEFIDDFYKTKVLSAMKLLADNGIGTDRNTGNGQFDYEVIDNFALDITDNNADFQVNLSLYCPHKQEIEKDVMESYYGLTKRGGYISNPQNPNHLTIRKRSIYMFTEGSVFPNKGKDRKGKLVDLKPENSGLDEKRIEVKHPIWRDGQAIFLPMKYKNED